MNRITSKITPGNSVPFEDRDKWQRELEPYTVQLRYKRRRFTFPFWTGSGWQRDPQTVDAAGAILSEAVGYENATCFEDWAADYGYDTDSREAERIYRAIGRIHSNVKRLLGGDFEALIYTNEDDLEGVCR